MKRDTSNTSDLQILNSNFFFLQIINKTLKNNNNINTPMQTNFVENDVLIRDDNTIEYTIGHLLPTSLFLFIYILIHAQKAGEDGMSLGNFISTPS